MEQEWICSICLEGEVVNGVELPCFILPPCNHRFHTACIVEALRRNGANCPLCRGLPDGPQLAQQQNHDIEIQNHIDQGIQNHDIQIQNHINQGIQNNINQGIQNNINQGIQNNINQGILDINQNNNMNEIIELVRNYNNRNNYNLNYNNDQIRNMIGDILNNNQNMNINNNNYDMFRNLVDVVREIQENNIQPDNYLNYINNNNINLNN
jgi:hypothetical protein